MAHPQPKQVDLFEVAELPGRPMLHWNGKRPLREIPYYPAQLRERYGSSPSPRTRGEGRGEGSEGWFNRLYWGDNLQVMAHLMREFRGKVKLIYIDPPFDSGADYRKQVKLRGQALQTDLGVLEERQYTDIWSNDLYLQYMYERLILMRELLSDDGALALHCDWRRSHHLRFLLDEVLGEANFRGEILVRAGTKNVQSQFEQVSALTIGNNTIHLYTKSHSARLAKPLTELASEQPGKWDTFWRGTDRPTMRYELFAQTPTSGQWRWSKDRAIRAVQSYREYIDRYSSQTTLDEYYIRVRDLDGVELDFVRQADDGTVQYYVAPRGSRVLSNVWFDLPYRGVATDYPTEKHEKPVWKLVEWLTCPGNLVADFFLGSGTTAAVAQKLGRRWIGADINLGAVHTTAQRLARIIEGQQAAAQQMELGKEPSKVYPAFEVYNVNHYEVFKNAEEARDIVCKLYGVERLKGHHFFDGLLDGRWVKVIDLNRICSKLDVQAIFDSLTPDDTRGVVVLCAGHEYDVPEAAKRRNLLNVPFELRDILTDRKDVIFKRLPEAKLHLARDDGRATLTVEQFYSPLLLQKLTLEDAPEAIEDWRQAVASVLIDPAYDGEVFQPRINDTPARRDECVRGEYAWEEAQYGAAAVAVKIVDVLDEEWFGVVEATPPESGDS